ncbi:hypothetical protein DSO57_1025096 [Entomophthora muscae]|uniref:Uncharacterized protein n=1 Tax=Entomophthora muscae TaxID=34485 RepID=A0ACC2TE07_9FUNG|nr:hypothetical protein DSO57_1025096 [Entomophthora muscae]
MAAASVIIKGEARYNNYPLSTTKCRFEDNSIRNYAAVGPSHFNSSLACGQCAIVKNLEMFQMVQVIIVDQCAGCGPTDIILDKGSFGIIGDLSQGFINVDWQMSACNVKGNVEYTWVLPPGTNLIALQ